jgi:hypothetical protein
LGFSAIELKKKKFEDKPFLLAGLSKATVSEECHIFKNETGDKHAKKIIQ